MDSLLSNAFVRGRALLLAACIVFSAWSHRPACAADVDIASEHFKAGRYGECLKLSLEAIEGWAYAVQWRTLMIESRMALGQYDQAVADTKSVLKYYSSSLRLLKLGHTVYQNTGRTEEAAEMLARIYAIANRRRLDYLDSEDLVIVGQALLLLGGEPRLVLDEFFNRAIKNDPNYREAYLAAGDLATAKQDYELAANQYRNAIKRFGDDPQAHYGLARAFYHSDRNQMLMSLHAALRVNPGYVPALILLAEHQIDCEDLDAAAKSLDRVFAVNPWNPDAWAYRAVLAHLAEDSQALRSCRANALEFWENNPRVDYVIGRKLSQKYRFTEAAEYQRRALKFDPEYLPAKIQLAEDLLRLGDEEQGWKLADEVHARDAYNIEAYNLVNLRDNIAKFKTLTTDGFIVRINKHEAAVYGESVIALLSRAKAKLCKKYGVELERPVTVELFDNQQDFAVRTFGMPGGDGFLGVCFGNVITANSPKPGRATNWQAMLWHEFCHVVTLNLTHNKMPRWLSEGISVYEEAQRNATWGQRMNPQYRRMILEGELTPVSNLSAAFLNPPSPMHLQFAYYESSLVVEFLVERFGFNVLKAILAELANGEKINAAISKHAEPIKKIEKKFEAFARKRAEDLAPDVDWREPEKDQLDPTDRKALAEWLDKHPNSFWALKVHANNLLADDKPEQAKKPLEKLISLYPQYTEEGNAYRLLAEIHQDLGEIEAEREVLGKLARLSADDAYAYGRLMEIETERENWREVVNNGDKYLAVYSMLAVVHRRLGRANEELGRDDQAVESYRRLLLLDPADPAEVNYRLARLLQHSDQGAAKRHILEALADAPRFRDAHRLLLKIVDGDRKPTPDSNEQNQPPTIAEDKQ